MKADAIERDLGILCLAASGLTNGAIACKVAVSEEVVKKLMNRVYARLQANNRAHAVTLGVARGHISIAPSGRVTPGPNPLPAVPREVRR